MPTSLPLSMTRMPTSLPLLGEVANEVSQRGFRNPSVSLTLDISPKRDDKATPT